MFLPFRSIFLAWLLEMTVLSLTSTFSVLWVHHITYHSLVQQVQ